MLNAQSVYFQLRIYLSLTVVEFEFEFFPIFTSLWLTFSIYLCINRQKGCFYCCIFNHLFYLTTDEKNVLTKRELRLASVCNYQLMQKKAVKIFTSFYVISVVDKRHIKRVYISIVILLLHHCIITRKSQHGREREACCIKRHF